MSRTGRIALALAAALAAPAPARAQWRPEPMVVWLERPGLDVALGTFLSAPGRDDVLVLDQLGRTARERRHAALLAPQAAPFPIASLPDERAFRTGYLAQNGADGLADVASHHAPGPLVSRVQVVFGSDPGTVRSFPLGAPTDAGAPPGGLPYVTSFLRLLPKSPPADVIVLPYCFSDLCSRLFVVDFDAAGAATVASRTAPNLVEPTYDQPEAFPVWLSATARARGLDDVAVGAFGTVVLFPHRSAAAAGATLSDLDLGDPIVVGTTRHLGAPPPWLPPTITGFSYVRGVATLDVDVDGVPDLVFTMAVPGFAGGRLVWVKGTGVLADFADPARATWHDLGALLGLVDPATVRPLRGPTPSIAVWDRTLQEVVVVTAVPAEGRLASWRAEAQGAEARDLRLADLAGSPAPDLVVVMENGAAPARLLVYPDLGLPGPVLRWASGSPGRPARGVPHPLAVVVDPAGATTVAVDWVQGAVTSAPVGSGLAHVFPPVCTIPPPPLDVTVRGTDETGVFTELRALLPLSVLEPALSLAGASPPGRLVLPPGGTSAVFEGTAATGCGAASFAGTPWPAEATVTDVAGPASLTRTVVLPEAAYPGLLVHPAFGVSLSTSDPGASTPVVTLPLAIDGSGLVEVSHEADRTRLVAGEVAVLRTRLRSRVGVALPSVRIVGALAGLEAAGPPVVSGAALLASGAGGADLLLDALPPAGAEVTIELPVRSTGGQRGSSSVEARSAGGWLLTAPSRAAAVAGPPPGCGCGAGAGPGLAALALAAAALRRRRRAT